MNEYQKQVDGWFKKSGWKYWHPTNQFVRLSEEVGELARIINHLYGEKPKKDYELQQDLEEEIGDVLYTLVCLANSQKIDLDKAMIRSIEKVSTRDKDRYKNKS